MNTVITSMKPVKLIRLFLFGCLAVDPANAAYDQIVQEKPDRVMVQEFRRANPNLPL